MDRIKLGEEKRDARINFNFCFNTAPSKKSKVEEYCAKNDKSISSFFREWLRKKLDIKGRSTADYLDEEFIMHIIKLSEKEDKK